MSECITHHFACDCREKKFIELEAKLKVAVEALEDANDFSSSVLEDLQHYFENKCIPTVDEVNQASITDSQLRYAIAKLKIIKGE